jgi:hypothetical protein
VKTILSLVVAALVVNACVRAGDSAWRNYQLTDAVEQAARYGNMKTTSLLRKRVIDLAREHDIALTDDDVVVEKRGQQTYVSIAYTESIPLVPRFYTHDQDYDITFSVEALQAIVDDKK